MTKFDLHMHSKYSADGQLEIKDLILMAKEKGLEYIALSDHDCISGVKEMMEEGSKAGIHVIPAIECSTIFDHHDVHLLGYGIDITNPYFVNLKDNLKKQNADVFHERIERLRKKYGVEVNEEQVIRDSHGKNPWFLLMNQIFENPEYQNIEDFQEYLPGGKRSDPAPINFFWDKCMYGSDLYVESKNPDFIDSVKKIHEAGGIAVLAHPFNTFYRNEELLQKAIEAGIEGIEAYSNYHTKEQTEYYEKFAKDHNLLISCGSDFHGILKPNIHMGEYGLEKDGTEILNNFLKVLKSY